MAKAKEEKVKEKEVNLQLRRRHPKKQMRLGRHLVKPQPQKLLLNEKELKELESKGGKHWFATPEQIKEEKEAAKASKEAIAKKIKNLEKQLPQNQKK